MPLKTDLHVHFLGVLSSKKLVNIGIKRDISIPLTHIPQSVKELIKCDDDFIKLSSLNSKQICKYVHSLELSKQTSFDNLTKCYFYRTIFFSNLDILEEIMIESAKEYHKFGIEYVELSSKWFANKDILALCEKLFPKIKEQYNVEFKFLCAIDRNYDFEKIERYLRDAKEVIDSPCIAGIDILGEEKDSILRIEPYLKKAVALVATHNRTIRVHSGETNIPDNIYNTLRIIDNELENLDCKCLSIRLGHCLYGLTGEAINLCKKLNAIVELNLSSNIILKKSKYDFKKLFKTLLDNNIKFVLGTDGYAIYKTCPKKELLLSFIFSKNLSIHHNIISTEYEFLNR